ncbi:MAG: hypothetical protein ACKON8_11835, partial [Planctomycetota bacterium]
RGAGAVGMVASDAGAMSWTGRAGEGSGGAHGRPCNLCPSFPTGRPNGEKTGFTARFFGRIADTPERRDRHHRHETTPRWLAAPASGISKESFFVLGDDRPSGRVSRPIP